MTTETVTSRVTTPKSAQKTRVLANRRRRLASGRETHLVYQRLLRHRIADFLPFAAHNTKCFLLNYAGNGEMQVPFGRL